MMIIMMRIYKVYDNTLAFSTGQGSCAPTTACLCSGGARGEERDGLGAGGITCLTLLV